jgi:HK97 family phage portal protein
LGNSYFLPIGNSNDIFTGTDYLKEFKEIPELNAILNIRARAMASWKLSILSTQTGKPAANNETIVKILRTPNWFQAQVEFWRQSSLFRDIFGNEFIYFLTPSGMGNTYKGMFTLDPSRVVIKYNSKNQYFLEPTNEPVEYFYRVGYGKPLPLEKKNLIHLNDNRVNISTEKFLYGTSKIESLRGPLANIREAYKKRNIILKMPIGIMSNGQADAIGQAVPMDKDEKELAQQALRNHGAHPVLTNLNVKYSDMNVNAANMGLFDEVREDVGRICDAYGVPYEILSSQKGVTFANLKEAKKQLYEETIIPDAGEKVDALNMKLDTATKSWDIVADFKHLPVFSEDKKQRAISFKQTVDGLKVAVEVGFMTVQQAQIELERFGI